MYESIIYMFPAIFALSLVLLIKAIITPIIL